MRSIPSGQESERLVRTTANNQLMGPWRIKLMTRVPESYCTVQCCTVGTDKVAESLVCE